MNIEILVLALAMVVQLVSGYSIGGGATENGGSGGGTTYNNGGTTNIGGGVQPTNNNGGTYSPTGSYYCSTNSDCSYGQSCTSSVNGVKICLSSSNTNSCTSNADCQTGESCVISATSRQCQVQVGGYVGQQRQDPTNTKLHPSPGELNSPCERDSNCNTNLVCTLYFGELMCRHPIKPIVPLRCETEADCPSMEYLCVFSTAIQDRICYHYGDTVTDGYVIPVKHKFALSTTSTTTTSTTPIDESRAVFEDPEESKAIFSEDRPALSKRHDQVPREPIYMKLDDAAPITMASEDTTIAPIDEFIENEPVDPAAIVCDKDYHCRMGESCTARIRFVDRNVTMCRYDTGKRNRQCIYHSDCLSGQRCKVQKANEAICVMDIQATIGNIECFYDYQCSGGEKCTPIGGEKDQKFVCRPPLTQDPRTNQICGTNADCPFQQVCRRSAGLSMCVNVTIAHNPTLIHQHFLQLFRSFLI